ncbi:hypothetical protein [Candidatus Gromoviella agglomerans]|uniref:hypothetical protein n=1 Tax=Candidatus Gromoviella agglomerans TaxID=2806609 RepID=UPI001E40BB7B|nr:hypothetical protein [Candidatus Gromoviella agglomerans]UFX98250.1 hypothetical protein Gromo_00133 [Candidatus Gromoviella agglomerans]
MCSYKLLFGVIFCLHFVANNIESNAALNESVCSSCSTDDEFRANNDWTVLNELYNSNVRRPRVPISPYRLPPVDFLNVCVERQSNVPRRIDIDTGSLFKRCDEAIKKSNELLSEISKTDIESLNWKVNCAYIRTQCLIDKSNIALSKPISYGVVNKIPSVTKLSSSAFGGGKGCSPSSAFGGKVLDKTGTIDSNKVVNKTSSLVKKLVF